VIVSGSDNWEWFDRGDVQELDGVSVEADGSMLTGGAGEQNGDRVFATLCRPVETLLEILQLNFYALFKKLLQLLDLPSMNDIISHADSICKSVPFFQNKEKGNFQPDRGYKSPLHSRTFNTIYDAFSSLVDHEHGNVHFTKKTRQNTKISARFDAGAAPRL